MKDVLLKSNLLLILSISISLPSSTPFPPFSSTTLSQSSSLTQSQNLFFYLSQELSLASINQILTFMEQDPEVEACFKQQNHKTIEVIEINLREHHQMVLGGLLLFPKLEKRIANIDSRLIPWFRFILAVHDAGKGKALIQGERRKQHQYTLEIIERLFPQWNVPDEIKQLAIAIIDSRKEFGDGASIGKMIRGRADPKVLSNGIQARARFAQMNTADFFELYTIYHTLDAATYIPHLSYYQLKDGDISIQHPNYEMLLRELVDRYSRADAKKTSWLNSLPDFEFNSKESILDPSQLQSLLPSLESSPFLVEQLLSKFSPELGFVEGILFRLYNRFILNDRYIRIEHTLERDEAFTIALDRKQKRLGFRLISTDNYRFNFIIEGGLITVLLKFDPNGLFWRGKTTQNLYKGSFPLSQFNNFYFSNNSNQQTLTLSFNALPENLKKLFSNNNNTFPISPNFNIQIQITDSTHPTKKPTSTQTTTSL